MENQKDLPKFQINKFVNDFFIKKNLQRIKAFGLFHICRLKCYQNPKNDAAEVCSMKCEQKLDSYFEEEQKQSIPNINEFFIKLDEEYMEKISTQEGKTTIEIKKFLLQMEDALKMNLGIMDERLTSWESEEGK